MLIILSLLISCFVLTQSQLWQKCGSLNSNPNTVTDCTSQNNITNLCCMITYNSTKQCYSFTNNSTYANLGGTFYSNFTSNITIDCGGLKNENTFFGVPYCGTNLFIKTPSACGALGTKNFNCCYARNNFTQGPFTSDSLGNCLQTNSLYGNNIIAKTLFGTAPGDLSCGDGMNMTYYNNYVNSNFIGLNYISLLIIGLLTLLI